MAQGAWDNGWDETQAQDAGFFGVRPHDVADDAYSLETGPDSPNGNIVAPDNRIWEEALDDPDYVAP